MTAVRSGLSLRSVFHLRYSSIVIPVSWATGIALVGLAYASESLHLPSGGFIVAAYAFFIAALLWSLGSWLTSDALTKRNPKQWSRGRAKRATEQDFRTYHLCKYGVSVLLALAFALAIVSTREIGAALELSRLFGTLYPGNDPAPSGPCSPREGEVALYIGTDAVIASSFPITIVRVADEPLLRLDRNADGSLALVADIRSSDNKIIARLDRTGFTVNPNNYLSMKRVDRSSLVLVDQYGHEALNVRYMNRRNLNMTARLYSNGRLVDLGKREISGGVFSMSGVCMKFAPNKNQNFTVLNFR
ncbi:MAG TPA: hypothetical protein VGT24_06015 [Candidatus Acidoferrales bacterium]|nr:hypothetical protein [Candidatus Acidoferrales bacterium]